MKRYIILAGGIVAGLVLVCLVGWLIYSSMGGSGSDEFLRGGRGSLPDAASDGEVVVEQVVVEKSVEVPAARGEAMGYDSGIAYAAERLIVRTGNLSMVVDDSRAVRATIEEIVAGMAGEGAFVVSSQEYGATDGEQPRVSMTIRVPAARFDETMDRLADLAVRVLNSNESADDVTEEYVDLEARLESLEAARQRLLDIMAEARSTKDLLEAEQQLTQRESEIESIKGRMQYLEESARLSSISIELEPDILSQPVSEEWRPAETARRAVEALVDSLQALGSFAIFFSIAVLPWLAAAGLVILVVAWLVRWRTRRGRARRAAADSTAD